MARGYDAVDMINRPGSKRTLVPIALREDGTKAQVLFPTDMTKAEAEKIARVVLAYAEDRDNG